LFAVAHLLVVVARWSRGRAGELHRSAAEGAAMGEAGTSFLLSQLGYQAPALLVYLIAFILALIYMGRASAPSVLTLIGVGVLVVTTIGVAVAQAWLIDSRQAHDRDPAEFGRLMGIVGIAGSCVRAIGLGLLVAAIFVGRHAVVARHAEPGAAADPAS
jgi:hypothetical protein